MTVIAVALPRAEAMPARSCASRAPDSDVSATSARHSRVISSTKHRIRKRRSQANASLTKSRLPRWIGPLRLRHRRPGTQCPPAAGAAARLHFLLPIDTQQLLVVWRQPFATGQITQTPIAEERKHRHKAVKGRLGRFVRICLYNARVRLRQVEPEEVDLLPNTADHCDGFAKIHLVMPQRWRQRHKGPAVACRHCRT